MLSNLLSNPVETIVDLLISLPGLLIALCGHEMSHGLVAYWCGDDSAKRMGRITLNPLAHLDPVGFLCMLLFHFGWAKPVPVNPLNYRHWRRDDLLVSLAGITWNLMMFLLGCIIMYIPLTIVLNTYQLKGTDVMRFYQTAYGFSSVYQQEFGETAYYLFRMLLSCTTVNLSLALFNLLPIPPLDGYHVLNDTILHNKNLFAAHRISQIGMGILMLFLLVPQLSNLYSSGITWIMQRLFDGIGFVGYSVIHLIGLI